MTGGREDFAAVLSRKIADKEATWLCPCQLEIPGNWHDYGWHDGWEGRPSTGDWVPVEEVIRLVEALQRIRDMISKR